RTVGFTKNPFSFLFSKRIKHEINGTHEVQRNHSLVEWMVGPEVAKPKLYPSSQEIEKVKVYKVGSYITVSPASVWYTKQLKKERWIEFLAGLPHDLNVFLLGAASDFELCEVIKVEAPSARIVNLAGKLSMLESAALMCEAKMNYVNDSAPMHLASAMNAPVTAVFCSTVPKFGFGPLSDKSFVVETTEQLGCRPCGLHGYRACPKSHFKCALTIGKEQLMATLN
ncbi:MAG TPA: glycosyltransferase family 9 protein, partial [Cyclobacteriaceae bacterium]|nr:glycosyltransferase family 9 protein [Cyclobacteriaceae bacterium]